MHKGGQINNVQLITGVRIAEMTQLQNCSVMCTKKGSYCENEKMREKVMGGVRGMCTKNGSYCEKEKKVGGGGDSRGGGRVGGGVGGVRVDSKIQNLFSIQSKTYRIITET